MTQSKKYLLLGISFGFLVTQSLSAAVEVKINSGEGREGTARKKETMPTRALTTPAGKIAAGVTFGKSVFSSGTGYFGDTAGGKGTSALVKAVLTGDAKAGNYSVEPTLLAKDAALSGKQISLLSLASGQPAVITTDVPLQVRVVKNAAGEVNESVDGAIHDGDTTPIVRQPPMLAAGVVGTQPVIFAAVADAVQKPAIRWDNVGGVGISWDNVITDAFDAVKTNVAAKKAAAALGIQVLTDNTKNGAVVGTRVQLDAAIKTALEAAANGQFALGADGKYTLKVNDALGALGDGAGIKTAAANILNVPAAGLAAAVEPAAITDRTKTAAMTASDFNPAGGAYRDDETKAKVANVITRNDATGVNPIDRGDTLAAGAAAAIEGGIAWATRKAEVGDNEAVVKGLFNEGATAVYDIYDGAGDKPFATYASNKVKGNGDIQTAAAGLIKFTDPWNAAQGVNARIAAAAADTAYIGGIDLAHPANLDDIAATAVAIVDPFVKVTADNVVLNAVLPGGAAPGGGAENTAKMALAATKPAAAAFLNALTQNGAGNFALDDFVKNGYIVALEAALAKAVGMYQMAYTKADTTVVDKSTSAQVATAMNDILGTRVTNNTLIKLLATNNVPLVTVAAEKVKAEPLAEAELKTSLYASVQDAVMPRNWLVFAAANNRTAKAAIAANTIAQADKGASKMATLAFAVNGASTVNNVKNHIRDNATLIYDIAIAQSTQTIKDAVAVITDAITAAGRPNGWVGWDANQSSSGVAAACVLGLGLGLRRAVVGTDPAYNQDLEKDIRAAITQLKGNAAVGVDEAHDRIAELDADGGGGGNPDAFRVGVANAVVQAVQAGAAWAAEGMAKAVAKGKTDATGIIAQLKSSVPYLQQNKMAAAAEKGALDFAQREITGNPVNVANTAQAGMRAALEAALVWGADNYKLQGQFFDPTAAMYEVDNPVAVHGTNPVAVNVSAAADIQASALAAATQVKTAIAAAAIAHDQSELGAQAVVNALTEATFQGNVSDIITTACGNGTYRYYYYSYYPAYSRAHRWAIQADQGAGANASLGEKLNGLGGIAKADFRAACGNGSVLIDTFNQDTVAGAAGSAAAAITANDVNRGAAAGVIGALGVGIRNMHVVNDPAWVNAPGILLNIESKIVKPMIKAVWKQETDVGGARPNPLNALNALWTDDGGAGGQANNARAKIAQIIWDSAVSGHKAAAEKARALANIALLVNNLVNSPNFAITEDVLNTKINTESANISAIAQAADATAAATVAKGYALADAGAAGNLTVAGAAAALEASLGWGVRNATMANTTDEIKNMLTVVGGTGVLDKLTGGKAVGGYDPDTSSVANAIANKLKGDNATRNALVERIKSAVTAGTGAATVAMVTAVKGDTGAATVVGKAAAQLKVEDVDLGLTQARQQAAAGAAAVAGAAAAGVPVGGLAGDQFSDGAKAALDTAVGWVLKQANVNKANAIADTDARPWKSQKFRDGGNRGIAVLTPAAAAVSVEEQGGAAKAVVLDVAAKDASAAGQPDTQVAFKATAGGIGAAYLESDQLCMHVDDKLGLYVGLQDVRRGVSVGAAPNKGVSEATGALRTEGGIIGVLTGKFDAATKQLALKSVLAAPVAGMLPNAGKEIIGFHAGADIANDTMQTSIWNLRTMHTSTGKDYLIVNGDTRLAAAAANSNSWIYALPVLPATHATNPGQLAGKTLEKGAFKLATAGDLYSVDTTHLYKPGDAADFTAAEQPAVVGRDPRLIGGDTTDKSLAAMEVVGDTVYVAMAEARTADAAAPATKKVEAGIFASTALFDANGLIANWTPWKRVGGTTDKVHGFGMEPTAATALYLAGDTKDTIKSSAWGESGQVVSTAANSRQLTDALKTVFEDVGGVFQVYNFDENTPGFAPGKFSMMVAVGPDRVVLIQTADFTGGVLAPTTKFATTDPDRRVFEFKASDYPALKDIMPLTCAEVLKKGLNAAEANGYLYVGGYKGLARMELKTAGNHGWSTAAGAGLDQLKPAGGGADDFPGGANWTFKKLDGWNGTCVVGLAGTGNNLQVISLDKVSKANSVGAVAANAYKSLDNAEGQYGCDMVLVNDKVIAATTDGLYVTSADMDKDFVKVRADLLPATMVPVQLAYISSDLEKNSNKGDLYVLAINREKEESKVYRFAVDKDGLVDYALKTQAVVNDINGQTNTFPMKLSNYARQFATDGSVLLAVRSTVPGVTDVVQVGMLRGHGASDVTKLSNDNLNIDTNTQAAYVARPVKDSATGAWIVPGDFYARVNE